MKNKKCLLLSTLLILCGCAASPSSEPSTSEENSSITDNTSEESSSISSVAQTSNIVLPNDAIFPELRSFITPSAYRAPANDKFKYQAKVDGNKIFVYLRQNIAVEPSNYNGLDYDKTHVTFTLRNNSVSNKKLTISLFPNGESSFEETEKLTSSLLVKTTATIVEYYFVLESNEEITGETKIKFYSFDETTQTPYVNNDYMETVNDVLYHTHIGDGWSVGANVGFKNEEYYRTPTSFASPAKDYWGYDMTAQKEGLYIYAYQYVDEVVLEGNNDTKWQLQTHIELEIWQHNFGYGVQYGLNAGTYLALFANETTYINREDNVKGMDFNVSVTKDGDKDKVEYRFFICFENNFDNPQDGPYAFIKLRAFDPKDEGKQYTEEDVVDYRDERFVHTNPGNSVFVHNTVDTIDDPFTTTFAQSRLNLYNSMNMPGNGTLFIGDSYFEKDNWWTNFYTDYAGKNCFTSAIGGTRITQWLNYYDSLIKPYNPKNIVIHLGYNDINGTQATPENLSSLLQTLIELLHSKMPSVNIYYFNVESSPWFKVSNQITRVTKLNELTKTFIDQLDYCTYIDGNAISKDAAYEYNPANGTWVSDEFFKDGTHPKNENYALYMKALVDAGCVIEDL